MCDNFLYLWVCLYPSSLSLFLSFLVSRFPKSLSLSVSLSLPFLRLWISWPTLMKIRSSNERGKGRNILNKKYGTAPIQTFIVKKIPSPLTYLLAYLQPPPPLIPHPTDDVDNLKAKFRLGGESVVQWIPRAEVLLECDFSTTWPQLWYPSGLRFETIKPKNKVIWLCLVCWHVMVILFVLIT